MTLKLVIWHPYRCKSETVNEGYESAIACDRLPKFPPGAICKVTSGYKRRGLVIHKLYNVIFTLDQYTTNISLSRNVIIYLVQCYICGKFAYTIRDESAREHTCEQFL